MRQSVRALGWTITLCTVLLFAFLATAVYSVFQMVVMAQGIGLGEFQTSFSDNKLVLSVPITVNNTGYYDMSDFKIETKLKDPDGAALVEESTTIEEIKRGLSQSRSHNLSLSLIDILSRKTNLLFNDTEFRIDLSVGFRYAYALGFQLDLMNMAVPWGAPLYGLNLTELGQPSFNGTHLLLDVAVELENHSFLEIAASLKLRVYNEMGRYIGSGTGLVYVPPGSGLSGPVDVAIEVERPVFTGRGYVEVYLEIPMIDSSFELGRLDYG